MFLWALHKGNSNHQDRSKLSSAMVKMGDFFLRQRKLLFTKYVEYCLIIFYDTLDMPDCEERRYRYLSWYRHIPVPNVRCSIQECYSEYIRIIIQPVCEEILGTWYLVPVPAAGTRYQAPHVPDVGCSIPVCYSEYIE